MNKPTISIQNNAHLATSQLNERGSSANPTAATEQTFNARNLVIKPDSIQMEVTIDGRWQGVRLASQSQLQQPLKLPEAEVKLSADGTLLTVSTPELKLQIKPAQTLLSLLSLIKGLGGQSALQLDAQLKGSNQPTLILEKIGLALPVPPALADLLKQENKLIANLSARQNNLLLQIFNAFGDELMKAPVSKHKLTSLLAQLGSQKQPKIKLGRSSATLQLANQQVEVKTPEAQGALKLNSWFNAQLKAQPDGLQIGVARQSTEVKLATPLQQALPKLATHRFAAELEKAISPAPDSKSTLSYDKPLLNVSMADIKQTVKQAIGQWLSRPFFTLSVPQSATTVLKTQNTTSAQPAMTGAGQNITQVSPPPRAALSQMTSSPAALVLKNMAPLHSQPLLQLLDNIEQVFTNINKQGAPKGILQTPSAPPAGPVTERSTGATQASAATTEPSKLIKASSQTPLVSPAQVPAAAATPKGAQPAPSVATDKAIIPTPSSPQLSNAFSQRLALLQQVFAAVVPQLPKPYSAQQLISPQLQQTLTLEQGSAGKSVAPEAAGRPAESQPSQMSSAKAEQAASAKPSLSLPIAQILSKTLRQIEATPAQSGPPLQQQLSETLSATQQFRSPQSADLMRLVHQAFSKMMDETRHSPEQVSHELFARLPALASQIQPTLPNNSFAQALDKLIVTLLGTQLTAKAQDLPPQTSLEQRVATLVETLQPGTKLSAPGQFIQAVTQQAQSRLMDDLALLQNNLANNASPPPLAQKFDSESQLLINLFMPLKLPQECRQSELQIGKYKKPAKANMPEKQVWFVRLNFDYAKLGQLSVQAELMDKAVDCEIVGDSASVCQLAQPHLDALRSKLAAHGLQVGEIELREDASQVKRFYDSHAIVSIQV
ncbi:flagellar hook-length control protein FliK [Pseudoalteromonas sp. OOF1S-7]|uniref:flagellar hook-length control protein FliK n=1 Tax=Pseudoalteromonas sp. OOF1S-7 TaxID=2917757 RepID=UPI001EF42129|nr:flagellar hook-length control protein FliK [Pseudoalteromonas sp. OOF1S-7]MCG7537183.1 flagellar hook-length control protein FliK [Pseudoalteromonas sp. OOF1S-7]